MLCSEEPLIQTGGKGNVNEGFQEGGMLKMTGNDMKKRANGSLQKEQPVQMYRGTEESKYRCAMKEMKQIGFNVKGQKRDWDQE